MTSSTRINDVAVQAPVSQRLALPAPVVPPVAPALPAPVRRVKALRRFAFSITLFTILGHLFLGFEQAPVTPLAVLALGYGLDLGLETLSAWAEGRKARYRGGFDALVTFLLPTHISCLACAMLLYANANLGPYLLAAGIAVTSKYILKTPVAGGWRHTLNPSNLGIAAVLVLFPWVGIAPPYQFTASVGQPVDTLVPLVILVAGTLLNLKLTGKGWLIAGWLGAFLLQAFARHLLLGHDLLAALAPMTGVAFVLFTNYMITDPGSTPVARRAQILFGAAVGLTYGLLVANQIVFGLFFALVAVCLVRTVALWVTWGVGVAGARQARRA